MSGDDGMRHRRVLYVEDNPVNAALMVAVLGMLPGIALEVCVDGASGLAGALREPPDLFLLDMNLPDTNGIELLRRLREHDALRSAPAYVVSAAALPEDIARALGCGFSGYWTKPLDVERVLAEIDGLLGLSARST